jgi:hypothetical protein
MPPDSASFSKQTYDHHSSNLRHSSSQSGALEVVTVSEKTPTQRSYDAGKVQATEGAFHYNNTILKSLQHKNSAYFATGLAEISGGDFLDCFV